MKTKKDHDNLNLDNSNSLQTPVSLLFDLTLLFSHFYLGNSNSLLTQIKNDIIICFP